MPGQETHTLTETVGHALRVEWGKVVRARMRAVRPRLSLFPFLGPRVQVKRRTPVQGRGEYPLRPACGSKCLSQTPSSMIGGSQVAPLRGPPSPHLFLLVKSCLTCVTLATCPVWVEIRIGQVVRPDQESWPLTLGTSCFEEEGAQVILELPLSPRLPTHHSETLSVT